MDFLKLAACFRQEDSTEDDTVTESTEKIIRNPRGFYFDIVLDIIESHVKQNIYM